MPYYYDVKDGKITTLREFALLCAHAFSLMYKTSNRDPIPTEVVADLTPFDRRIADTEVELQELAALSEDEKQQRVNEFFDAQYRWWQEYTEKRQVETARYRAMLDQVEAWQPPEVLDSLKSLMRGELIQHLEVAPWPEPTRETAAEWFDSQVLMVKRRLESYQVERERIQANAAAQNEWVQALHASLPPEPVEPVQRRAERNGVLLPVLTVTPEEFKALLEYSHTLPTGKIIGKRWKAYQRQYQDDPAQVADLNNWVIGEYTRESETHPGMIDMTWYAPEYPIEAEV